MGLSAQARRAITVLGGKEITTRDGTRVVLDKASSEREPYVLIGRMLETGAAATWTEHGVFRVGCTNSDGLHIDIKGWIEKMTAPKPEYTAEQILDVLKGKELIARDGRTRVRLNCIAAMTCIFPLIGQVRKVTDSGWISEYWKLDGSFQHNFIHDCDIDIARYMTEAKYGEVKSAALELHDASTVTVPRRPEAVAALEAAINLFAANITQHFKRSDSLDDLKVLLDHRYELQALLARLKA